MSLHWNHANGGCGLPGVEEITEKKCEKLMERIAEKRSLPEGLIKRKGKWSFLECQNTVKIIPSERARRNEDMGFGIT